MENASFHGVLAEPSGGPMKLGQTVFYAGLNA